MKKMSSPYTVEPAGAPYDDVNSLSSTRFLLKVELKKEKVAYSSVAGSERVLCK